MHLLHVTRSCVLVFLLHRCWVLVPEQCQASHVISIMMRHLLTLNLEPRRLLDASCRLPPLAMPGVYRFLQVVPDAYLTVAGRPRAYHYSQ